MRIAGLLALALLLPAMALASQVNINTANATLLDTLPGIGPSKAAAIIDYRTKNGPFAAIADIQNVKGIGPTTFANLEKLITVDVQPSPIPVSSKKVKTVEPISNPPTNIQTHDEAVTAPTTAVEPAVVGARSSPLFHSPWLFGLLGVIVVASGAFILL